MNTNPVTEAQIRALTSQSCSADDWRKVFLAPECDVSRIRRAHFGGEVHLGANSGTITHRGIPLPCGVYDAMLVDCVVGTGVRIAFVRTGISRYRIEDGALVQDVGVVSATPGAAFGNGTTVEVLNEAGGRSTRIFNRLSAQVAYLNALFRHNPAFIEKIRDIVTREIAASTPDRGVIGRGARLVGSGTLQDVIVGPFAHIEGVLMLEDGTINSCEEHPTVVGADVHAKHFVIAEGATVESGVILERAFVGQGVRMGKQFSTENSVYFANCEAFQGEGVSVFAGPYTVTHHKSTLLIAGLFSFYNAGSGTNQSNHMYKLGPVHQGIFERGCKTGSFSYVLMESHIGAFTVVIGKHMANIRTPNLPFSHISEKGGDSTIFPGLNLFSVGTVRDGDKWPKRDNRKMKEKRDFIVFDVFSPYTVEKMRKGRDELLALNEITPKDRLMVPVGGVQMPRVLLKKGAKYYQLMIRRYLFERIMARMFAELEKHPRWEDALRAMKPTTSLTRASEWTDLCGMLTPVECAIALEADVAKGKIETYNDLLAAIKKFFEQYRAYEWQYIVETFELETESPIASLTKVRVLELLEDWKKTAQSIQSSIIDDSKKEFGSSAKIGFGLDLPESMAEADFAAVRGTIETNTIIKQLTVEAEELAGRIEAIQRRVEAVS